MPTIVNDIRRGLYLDSVALMRMSRTVAAMTGVAECGMMMGTPANMRIMADADVLAAEGRTAAPGDLVIAIRASDAAAAEAALAAARALLDAPKSASAQGAAWAPRTIRAALTAAPRSNLALISVPGAFAAAEARKALNRGLNVLMFSDNVPVADEVALKTLAREQGLLMMGPDCGTAIINGTPLGFANAIPRGDIGLIGASGTGIQEVACLIANAGGGISHAIGVGGRDLKAEVGAITTLLAFDLLDADPTTRHIVLISKPPADAVAAKVLARVAQSKKPCTICFLGGTALAMPSNAKASATLRGAADLALNRALPRGTGKPKPQPGKLIRGLFAGGTLCAEAQVVLLAAGLQVASNAAIKGVLAPETSGAHLLLDLGDDAYTQGRPHPMIEPAVRTAPLQAALKDASVGVILLDVVLGTGGHPDPSADIAATLASAGAHGKTLIAAITGTAADAQSPARQRRTLEAAGCLVLDATADAAALAVAAIQSV
jgi:FdrA protein